ncbi:hypothetical protein GOV04_06010 [Candidatus Woesearchaeota archaeon]|nr:hypothetical protein [Candidatus Woesearchaeota archaeon]
MKKILLAIGLILTLLVFTGCQEETVSTGVAPFIGGTTGIVISFTPSAPPTEVFDGGDFPFDVDIKLKNEGEWDVDASDASITISGIRAEDFSKSFSQLTQSPDEDLEGSDKSITGTITEGTETHVTFSNLNYESELTGSLTFPIQAELCYVYGTKVSSKVCIREDLLKDKNAVCEVNEAKQVFSSSAPVQVVSLNEVATGSDKVAFIFKIKHVGSGEVYEVNSDCTKEREFEDIVHITVDSGLPGLQCSGLTDGTSTEGDVRLFQGEREIRCTQEVNNQGNYEKPIDITLEYDYDELIKTEVNVLHQS